MYNGSCARKIGTTSERPTLSLTLKGHKYFDTTLGKEILWNGSTWVDATDTPV